MTNSTEKRVIGSGGRHRKSLRGHGPTPKAEDRVYHKAHKAKVAHDRRMAADPRAAARRRADKHVAKNDETITGFVAFTDEELAWLYVRPDRQRRGIGRALAEYALSRMEKGEKSVEVLCGNEPARNLYRSLGFTKETIVHGVMPGNEAFPVTVWQLTMML